MANIDLVDIRRLDLNLAAVFLALWEERSVTRAASRLALSQAAVSAALARLRETCGDELFVRVRGGMAPTPRALEMADRLHAGVADLVAALAPAPAFDPRAASRRFTIGMSDDFELAVGPALSRRVLRAAPQLSLVFRQTNRYTVEQMLRERQIELALTVDAPARSWLVQEPVVRSHYACLVDAKRWRIRLPLTLEAYLGLPHVLVSFSGREGAVDAALKAVGRTRRVQTALTHFSALPPFLAALEAVATIPAHAAQALARVTGLTVCPPPMPMGDYEVALTFRRDAAEDAGLAWLRGVAREALREAFGALTRRGRSGRRPGSAA